MKHAHVDETLTRTEREAPFRLSPPDPALDDGPTRLACVVTETGDGVDVEEFDALGWLRGARLAAERMAIEGGFAE